MTRLVNSWNEWAPLKRVLVGRPEGTNLPAPEPAWQHDLPDGGYPLPTYGPFPADMVDGANEQMQYFVEQLEKRGVEVERIDVQPFMFNEPLLSPLGWTQLNAHGVNNIRDVTLIHGRYIVEATTCRRSRVHERFNLRPIFERYFKEDPEVVHFSAPLPMLTDESYVPNYYYDFEHVWSDADKRKKLYDWEFQLTEKEPLWDAADAMRFGRDIFHQGSCVTNRAGFDWLKRMFAELGIRVHLAQFDTPADLTHPDNYHPWHIDVDLVPLRPGLCMYNPDWAPRTPELWQLFEQNDWELVAAARPTYVHDNSVALYALRGHSWISMNTLSLDPNTVFVEAHETAYCEQLDKLGFEVIPIPYEKVIPFGGALHCTTLDVYREGRCEDYFPRQIPGY